MGTRGRIPAATKNPRRLRRRGLRNECKQPLPRDVRDDGSYYQKGGEGICVLHSLKIIGSTLIVNPSLRSSLEPKQVERMATRETIEWGDFERVELRAGTVVEARAFPEARRPAYRLRVDFGPEVGVLQSSAQITDCYQPDDLVGRQVLAVVNFPPKQIGPMRSECLVTGLHREDGAVVLAVPDAPVPNGACLA